EMITQGSAEPTAISAPAAAMTKTGIRWPEIMSGIMERRTRRRRPGQRMWPVCDVMGGVADGEKDALLLFLEAQRASVLAILDGLDDGALTTPVPPVGWTLLGMVEHLGYAERHWFQEVLTGTAEPLTWPEDNHAPLITPRSPAVVLA